jgi:predicted transcriptional regulator
MGRPPLNDKVTTVKTTVRLTSDIQARIDAVAGPNRMAIFIREAIERELKRREAEVSRKS